MQRYTTTTWTGDTANCAHRKMLSFSLGGQPYSACDLTSQLATVVVRQYQNAIFSPLMRVHGWTRAGPPKFPFNYGGAAHRAAFRAALELRYHFLPHLYSLAHRAYREGVPRSPTTPSGWSGRTCWATAFCRRT